MLGGEKTRMWITVFFIILTIIQSIRLIVEKVKLAAFAYFTVTKGYTEPTEAELEQCIKTVIKHMVADWFKEKV